MVRRLLPHAAAGWFLLSPLLRAAEAPTLPAGAIEQLEEFSVTSSRADVEVWPEEQRDMFPFGTEGVFGDFAVEDKPDTGTNLVQEELSALPPSQIAEFASVSGAGTPRGFTTPRLRNGLTQLGFPEQIVGGRRDLLTGFLAVLYGRTAPGGIVNLISRRPSPKPTGAYDAVVSTRPSYFVQAERAQPFRTRKPAKKKAPPPNLHGRVVVSGLRQEGPEDFAKRDEWVFGTSLRYAPDKLTVLLLELEAAFTRAVPGTGIPATRAVPGAKTGAPALALAGFSTDGPHARSERDSLSLSLWGERKLSATRTLRGGAQWWAREQTELRFATGPYVLSTGRFDGTREPQFNDRREHTLGAQVEFDQAIKGRRLNQRWLVGLEGSAAVSDREKRALPKPVRDALPGAVRFLDPLAPDYSLPAYSAALYSRELTLRDESADYLGVFASDRLSWGRGRYGATFGLRHDRVHGEVDDLLAGAKIPHSANTVQKTTYHSGLVVQLARGFAGFANLSSAFQPTRRVDARTGKIQGSESTQGAEAGVRWQTPTRNLLVTAAVYRLSNQNITRNNPIYEDPVLDPDRTQPQLVASGEERFSGADVAVRWNPWLPLTLDVRGGWLEAITTSSPDLPEEVGRQLPRTPRFTGSTAVTYAPGGTGKGWQGGAAWAWIGAQTATYESRTRELVAYDGYGVIAANVSYNWESNKRRSSVAFAVRNVFDRDLAAATGRLGGERLAEAKYALRF